MAGKVWLITGASRGFGAETVKAALASGDKVVATARSIEGLAYLNGNENALPLVMDVINGPQVDEAVAAASAQFQRIDILVNNAGYGLVGAIEECSAAEVENLYRTNVFGLLNVTRAVLPGMRKRKFGRIINISSLGGYASFPGWGLYCSTKFAVEGISEALHGELAPLGIRVTVVEPGYFRTDFLDGKSLISTAQRIPDYAETVGKMRDTISSRNHDQPGDPAKLAAVLVQLAGFPEPPLRLPLGSDTLQRISAKNALVESEIMKWQGLSVSTDLPEKVRKKRVLVAK
jgi:NAD(P)-dependent dehydrogenase (short-subunit alcohol dehydrogenase family)